MSFRSLAISLICALAMSIVVPTAMAGDSSDQERSVMRLGQGVSVTGGYESTSVRGLDVPEQRLYYPTVIPVVLGFLDRAQFSDMDGLRRAAMTVDFNVAACRGLRSADQRARENLLSGSVVLQFEIDEEGNVGEFEFRDDLGTMETHGQVRRCVISAVKNVEFPAPDDAVLVRRGWRISYDEQPVRDHPGRPNINVGGSVEVAGGASDDFEEQLTNELRARARGCTPRRFEGAAPVAGVLRVRGTLTHASEHEPQSQEDGIMGSPIGAQWSDLTVENNEVGDPTWECVESRLTAQAETLNFDRPRGDCGLPTGSGYEAWPNPPADSGAEVDVTIEIRFSGNSLVDGPRFR